MYHCLGLPLIICAPLAAANISGATAARQSTPNTSAKPAGTRLGLCPPRWPGPCATRRWTSFARTQLTAQHRTRDGHFAHDRGRPHKKALAAPLVLPRLRPKKAQKKWWEALELDEMRTFEGRTKRKVWLWLAVERLSRRIVAWILGQRDAATARRLWQALPKRYRCPGATAATAGISLTCESPTWVSCLAGTTGTALKETVAPASLKPSIIPYANAAVYWPANLARSASPCRCTICVLKS